MDLSTEAFHWIDLFSHFFSPKKSQHSPSIFLQINSEISIFECLIQKNFMPVQLYCLELRIPRMPKRIGAADPSE